MTSAKNIGIYGVFCFESVKKCENTIYLTIFRGAQKCENKLLCKNNDDDNKKKKKNKNKNKNKNNKKKNKHKHATKRCVVRWLQAAV